MYYIGLMSGTSADGIDAVLLFIPPAGKPEIKSACRHEYSSELRAKIESLVSAGEIGLDQFGELDTAMGEQFAQAANTVLQIAGLQKGDVTAIGSHGQTVRHRPGVQHPFSLQVGNPSVIAEMTGITTVADFRARDIAAGGQGAPLVPFFHQEVFHADGANRVIVNVGGIANLTYLPGDRAEAVTGFDTGPGNTLLDRWAEKHLGKPYDQDGAWAASGTLAPDLLERMLADRYFQTPPPKSTGREYFNLGWLESLTGKQQPAPSVQDVQATLVALTARSITVAIQAFTPAVNEVYVCGGGVHNGALMRRLGEELDGVPLADTDALGFHPDWVEAAAFAWLAHRTIEGLAGNLPSVTGAGRAVILGGIYPGTRHEGRGAREK